MPQDAVPAEDTARVVGPRCGHPLAVSVATGGQRSEVVAVPDAGCSWFPIVDCVVDRV